MAERGGARRCRASGSPARRSSIAAASWRSSCSPARRSSDRRRSLPPDRSPSRPRTTSRQVALAVGAWLKDEAWHLVVPRVADYAASLAPAAPGAAVRSAQRMGKLQRKGRDPSQLAAGAAAARTRRIRRRARSRAPGRAQSLGAVLGAGRSAATRPRGGAARARRVDGAARLNLRRWRPRLAQIARRGERRQRDRKSRLRLQESRECRRELVAASAYRASGRPAARKWKPPDLAATHSSRFVHVAVDDQLAAVTAVDLEDAVVQRPVDVGVAIFERRVERQTDRRERGVGGSDEGGVGASSACSDLRRCVDVTPSPRRHIAVALIAALSAALATSGMRRQRSARAGAQARGGDASANVSSDQRSPPAERKPRPRRAVPRANCRATPARSRASDERIPRTRRRARRRRRAARSHRRALRHAPASSTPRRCWKARTAPSTRHSRRSAPRLLRDESELQPRHPRSFRPTGQRLRHRLRRRARARDRCRRRSAQGRLLRRRQERRGDGGGARGRHPLLQRRIGGRARAPDAVAAPHGTGRAR